MSFYLITQIGNLESENCTPSTQRTARTRYQELNHPQFTILLRVRSLKWPTPSVCPPANLNYKFNIKGSPCFPGVIMIIIICPVLPPAASPRIHQMEHPGHELHIPNSELLACGKGRILTFILYQNEIRSITHSIIFNAHLSEGSHSVTESGKASFAACAFVSFVLIKVDG